MENKEIFNTAEVAEAIELLKNENIKILGDEVVFYIKHVEEVDSKPEQLIGIESDDDIINELNRMYLDVVAVGPEVKNIKVGDKIYGTHRVIMSTENFSAGTLKFQLVSERQIKVVKEA